MNHMDLTDIFKAFHPKGVEYTFKKVHGTISKIDYNLGHETSLNNLLKTEMLSSIFFKHKLQEEHWKIYKHLEAK